MKMNRFKNTQMNISGRLIKEYRKKANYSQEELCTKLALLGVTLYRNDIHRIETNQRTIKDYELAGICEVLKIDVNIIKEEVIK